ncbi:hypothetical protein Tco_1429670 [Tanacetum coccineum]
MKNMAGYKMEHFKEKSFYEVNEMFDKAYKQVTSFVPMDSVMGKERTKRAGLNLQEESSKRQKTGEVSRSAAEQQELDDLVKLWSLVQEKFNSTEPTYDKERELWVELKRVDIYMLVEREYLLSRGTLTLMLVAKLLVDEDSEIARELIRKIVMQTAEVKITTAEVKITTDQVIRYLKLGSTELYRQIANLGIRVSTTVGFGFGFDEYDCVIQDLKKENVLGTGSEFGGLYVLGHPSYQVWSILKDRLGLSKPTHAMPCEVIFDEKKLGSSYASSDYITKSSTNSISGRTRSMCERRCCTLLSLEDPNSVEVKHTDMGCLPPKEYLSSTVMNFRIILLNVSARLTIVEGDGDMNKMYDMTENIDEFDERVKSKLKTHEKRKLEACSMSPQELVEWAEQQAGTPYLRTPPLKPRRKCIEFPCKNLFADFLHCDSVADEVELHDDWKYEGLSVDGYIDVVGSSKCCDLVHESVGYNGHSLPNMDKECFSNDVLDAV